MNIASAAIVMSITSTQPRKATAYTLQACLIGLFAFQSVIAQPVWSLWKTTDRAYNSVRFLDKDTAIFGGTGTIDLTTDGGGSFSNIFPEYLFDSDQLVVAARSADTVWTLGTPSASIRWTTDGGQTWETKVAGRDLGGATWIVDAGIAADGTAIFVGEVGKDPAYENKTKGLLLLGNTDGEFSRISPIDNELGYTLWDVFVTKQGRIWISGTPYILLSSDDNGLTWESHEPPNKSDNDGYDWHIFFLDDGLHGWLLSQRFLFRTTDGGETWEQITPVSEIMGDRYDEQWEPLRAIFFVSPEVGWGIYHRLIVHTVDGGLTWSILDVREEVGFVYLWDMWFVSPDEGWIVGGNGGDIGIGDTGVILRTQPAGVGVSSDQPAATTPLTIFPNPVSGTAEIQFSLDRPTETILEVYDILGRRVETIKSGARNEGLQRIRWDRGDLRPGVYLIKLATGSGTATSSIVVN